MNTNAIQVSIDIKAKTLTVTLPLISPPRPSGSGKTLLVASTGGNMQTDAVVNDQQVVVGLNAYIYAAPKETKVEKAERRAPLAGQ